MRVTGHHAIGPARDTKTATGFGEPFAIERVVAGLEEYLLAPVAPLGDVMGQAGNDDAGDAGHERELTQAGNKVNTGVSP